MENSEQILRRAIDLILITEPNSKYPTAVRNQVDDVAWRNICKGRRLALDGIKKQLTKALEDANAARVDDTPKDKDGEYYDGN